MSKSKVSSDFSKFYTQKARAFETAKTAEKQVRGIPVPKGTAGKALIVDFKADKAKGSEGNPYIAVEIEVIEPEEYRGKKFTGAIHSLYDSEKMDAAGRMAICLDDLEDMGLSREVRESHQSIDELAQDLLNTPHYVTFEVKEGYKGRAECKCFACDAPDSVKSDIVEYMGGKYHVVSRDGDQVTLRNVNNPEKLRTVPASEITA
jgi:hypothetical protein